MFLVRVEGGVEGGAKEGGRKVNENEELSLGQDHTYFNSFTGSIFVRIDSLEGCENTLELDLSRCFFDHQRGLSHYRGT